MKFRVISRGADSDRRHRCTDWLCGRGQRGRRRGGRAGWEDGGGGALFCGWCGTFRSVCRILKQRNM